MALAAFLEPERAELADLVATIRTERKKDAMAVMHDQVFRRVVRFLRAVFRLAGEDELSAVSWPLPVSGKGPFLVG